MAWKDRIVELKRVPAGELQADDRNWRIHTVGQRQAMREVLDSVGWASALIARYVDGELVLIDGHLRADLDPTEEVPVLVVDGDMVGISEGNVDDTPRFEPVDGMTQPRLDKRAPLTCPECGHEFSPP